MPKHVEKNHRRYIIPNLARALQMMEVLADQGQGMGITELAEKMAIPKNSAYRILCTLLEHGYVDRDEAGKSYRLSRKCLVLGYAAVGEVNLVEQVLPGLRDLRDQTSETALLAARIGCEGVVLEQVLGRHPVKIAVEIGHRFALHTGAPGKAIVAHLPEPEQQHVIDHLQYTRFNDRTIASKVAMLAEMKKVRALGYAVDHAEELDGVHCVGAPILNHRGYPIAGVWVTGPSYRLRTEDFPAVGKLVASIAGSISARFGYRLLKIAGPSSV